MLSAVEPGGVGVVVMFFFLFFFLVEWVQKQKSFICGISFTFKNWPLRRSVDQKRKMLKIWTLTQVLDYQGEDGLWTSNIFFCSAFLPLGM